MKDIQFYESLYAATEDGQIYSYRSKKFLKPKVRKDGYLEITLCKEGKKKSCLVHRLIAETFLPNPEGKPQISHLDETRSNNAVSNLAWADAKTNCNMPEHKKRKSESLMNNTSSKKVLCVETNTVYESMSEASRQLGCSPQNIYRACKESYRSACGYHWRYCS